MIDSCVKITLDVRETSMPVVVRAKQGDTGRRIHITLADGGMPYTISDDCFATFTGRKADKTTINNACTIVDNVIEYVFTEQTCSAVGRVAAEIRLYGSENKLLTSASFILEVHESVWHEDDPVSEHEMNALDALILEATDLINEVEQKLSDGDLIGPQGEPGKTPERGVDYWTQEDKQEINQYIQEAVEEAVPEAPENAVTYTAQTLTPSEQSQARANIGAMSESDTTVSVSGKAYQNAYKVAVTVNGVETEGPAMSLVRYDSNQTALTDQQKAQARTNIGAAGEIFYVHISVEDPEAEEFVFTADKTFAQIITAAKAGTNVVALGRGEDSYGVMWEFYAPLAFWLDNESAVFSYVDNKSAAMIFNYIVGADGTVTQKVIEVVDYAHLDEEVSYSVELALTEAKESGQFDGPAGPQGIPGDKGDKGDQGIQGIQGIQGEPGPAGYTPVRGTDYWTEADQAAMVTDVLAALPVWEGGSY